MSRRQFDYIIGLLYAICSLVAKPLASMIIFMVFAIAYLVAAFFAKEDAK